MSLNVPPVRKRRADGGGTEVEDDPFERAAARTRHSVIRDRADQPASLSLPEKVAEGTLRGVDHMVGYPSRLMGAAMGGHPETAGDPYEWGAGTALNMVGTGAALPKQPNTLGTSGSPPIRAYHGSPHDFDKFDMSKIGTGEGAQVYGDGLYLAGREGVSKWYRDKLSQNLAATKDGLRHHGEVFDELASVAKAAGGLHPDQANNIARQIMNHVVDDGRSVRNLTKDWEKPGPDDRWQRAYWDTANAAKEMGLKKHKGRMYEVDFHANPDHLLDWDKPLSRQTPQVAERLEGLGFKSAKKELDAYDNALMAALEGKADIPPGIKLPYDPAGHAIYRDIWRDDGGRPSDARRALLRNDIPGIKYRDQGSRGMDGAEATHNYVAFDDSLLSILRKYGIAGVAPAAGFAEAVRNGKTDETGESHMRRGYAVGGDIRQPTMGAPIGAPPPSSASFGAPVSQNGIYGYQGSGVAPTGTVVAPGSSGSAPGGGITAGGLAIAPTGTVTNPAYQSSTAPGVAYDPRHPGYDPGYDPRHPGYAPPQAGSFNGGLGMAFAQSFIDPFLHMAGQPTTGSFFGAPQQQAAPPPPALGAPAGAPAPAPPAFTTGGPEPQPSGQVPAALPIPTFADQPSTAGFQGYGVRAHGGRIGRDMGGSLPVPGFAQRMASRGIDHAISNTSGALRSPIPGRTDKLPIDAPAGSYVLPADVVSGLPGAEGNSEAGHRMLENMFTSGPFGMKLGKSRGKATKFPRGMSMPKARAPRVKSFKGFDDGGAVAEADAPELVPIIAAGGEFILTPDQVASVGDGDVDAGHAILDEFVKQARRDNIKTLRGLPAPAKK